MSGEGQEKMHKYTRRHDPFQKLHQWRFQNRPTWSQKVPGFKLGVGIAVAGLVMDKIIGW